MTQYTFADTTKLALKVAEIENISIFTGMNKDELRTKYPRVNFSSDFFIDMMEQGYFGDCKSEKMIKDIPMSSRLRRILERYGIIFLSDINNYCYEDILMFRNLGEKLMSEFKTICQQHNINIISLNWIKDNMLGVYFDMWQLRRMFKQNIFYPEDLIQLPEDKEQLLIANDRKMKKKIALIKKIVTKNNI